MSVSRNPIIPWWGFKPPGVDGRWEERLRNNECQKNGQFYEVENYFNYFRKRFKIISQGVVASPTALVPDEKIRALFNSEEEKLKNSIFNENANQAFFPIAVDVATKYYKGNLFILEEKEKFLFDAETPMGADKISNLISINCDGKSGITTPKGNFYTYDKITLDSDDQVVAFTYRRYDYKATCYQAKETNSTNSIHENFENLDLIIQKDDELLIYRKDTVFQKKQSDR
jgi:hypothetical protein